MTFLFRFTRALGLGTEKCSSCVHRGKVRAAWYGPWLLVRYSELLKESQITAVLLLLSRLKGVTEAHLSIRYSINL